MKAIKNNKNNIAPNVIIQKSDGKVLAVWHTK